MYERTLPVHVRHMELRLSFGSSRVVRGGVGGRQRARRAGARRTEQDAGPAALVESGTRSAILAICFGVLYGPVESNMWLTTVYVRVLRVQVR